MSDIRYYHGITYRNVENHKLLEKGLPPGTLCGVVWQKFTDVSKVVSISRVDE
jgi:hypothetical protein